ncbi:MAG: hypothetical protein IJS61_07550 [Firmicutes bacterium]|nr:hypothetical protein [Bacillota bacterium]
MIRKGNTASFYLAYTVPERSFENGDIDRNGEINGVDTSLWLKYLST